MLMILGTMVLTVKKEHTTMEYKKESCALEWEMSRLMISYTGVCIYTSEYIGVCVTCIYRYMCVYISLSTDMCVCIMYMWASLVAQQ